MVFSQTYRHFGTITDIWILLLLHYFCQVFDKFRRSLRLQNENETNKKVDVIHEHLLTLTGVKKMKSFLSLKSGWKWHRSIRKKTRSGFFFARFDRNSFQKKMWKLISQMVKLISESIKTHFPRNFYGFLAIFSQWSAGNMLQKYSGFQWFEIKFQWFET